MFDNNSSPISYERSLPAVDVQPLLRLTYMWMAFGLLITAFVALFTANNETLTRLAVEGPLRMIAIFGSLGLVVALSWGINRISSTVAAMLFMLYAAVLGFTLSIIFFVYDASAISTAFFTAAGMFGVMTVFAFTSGIDLTKYGSYFMMALFGLIIAMIANMFIGNTGFDMALSFFGVVLFTALTAYDTQRIIQMANDPEINSNNDTLTKMSIIGALTLYLDFINLFLFLLRLFGGGRD